MVDYIEKLRFLLESDLIHEINKNFEELREIQTRDPYSNTIKEDLEYIKQIKKYFENIIIEIDNKEISQEKALDILTTLSSSYNR